jgi:hypothetical protein
VKAIFHQAAAYGGFFGVIWFASLMFRPQVNQHLSEREIRYSRPIWRI